jgi:hypothetical protein
MTEEQKEKKREYNKAWDLKNSDKRKEQKRAWALANAEKRRESAKAWKRKNKEKVKEQKREYQKKYAKKLTAKKYGITIDEYDSLYSKQNGLCAICGEGKDYLLCIDHCHKTGIVRGLLCKKCNLGLGYFRDNPEFIKYAYHYISRLY